MNDDVTSVQVRAELEDLLERDLLGPKDGPEEELPPRVSPAGRYLLGRLVPRERVGEDRNAEEELAQNLDLIDREVSAAVDLEEAEEEPESEATGRSGSMAASAIGLAFSVPADISRVTAVASWGRYEQAPSEIHETEQGRPRRTWHRVPSGGEVEIPLETEASEYLVPDQEQPGITVHYTVRHRGPRRVVELRLVNANHPGSESPDLTRIYQAGLTVTALDGHAAIFLGHNDPDVSDAAPSSDFERRHLELLHRNKRKYATGRQCAVDAFVRQGDVRAWKLSTTCFPSAEVPLVVPGRVPGLVLDMARLGSHNLSRDDLVRSLRPLVKGYREWIATEAEVASCDPEIERFGDAASVALDRAREIAGRLERAIELLRTDGVAREAFRFANQAMAMQRVRSEVVRARLASPTSDVSALLRRLDVPENRSWRPFQLAFVLLCLPGLTDPSHPDALRTGDAAQVQLLFFPTGGGKTEAYLGLTAYTFAIRRLQGVLQVGTSGVDAGSAPAGSPSVASAASPTALDGARGVAVLMRYTLRLLTAQQFQRAAALICACEMLRRERIAAGDSRWGGTPFRLGLWVGSSVTPNSFEDAEQQINERRGGGEGSPGGVLQLPVCPWCGSKLQRGRDVVAVRLRRRVLQYCSDPEGDCAFSRWNSPDEGLPVLTIDEEIYRLTPSLIIATVDKLAQLPWKAATAPLFGLVDTECPRHGWQNPDFQAAGWCGPGGHQANSKSGLPRAVIHPAMRLRPPDLIIQDELHLISDALGSMVGLYETVIDRLCSRPSASGTAGGSAPGSSGGGTVIRPVVVASTATVRRAADQAEQVFARRISVFPPPVLDIGETFFSSTVAPSPSTPGRRYRGVLAPGERLKAIEIRVGSTIMEHAQYLFDKYGAAADPYMTLVDYFTSTRELAGMRRLVEDDIADRLGSMHVSTKRRRPHLQELTGRMPSAKIADSLAALDRPFDPAFDTNAARAEYNRDPGAFQERAAAAGRTSPPIDVLLATSMLQVGVDVQRLGLMVVTGQPKNTAEYIQATSRVGRSPARPGLVVMIYQWSRPRDLAHYEAFAYDHDTFGLRVEGLTTTPFSDRALDRGLTGVLATAIRHSGVASLPNTAAQAVPLSGAFMSELMSSIAERAAVVTHDQAQADAVREELQCRVSGWSQRRNGLQTGRLGYKPGPDVTGLLREPDEGAWDPWTVPMSMREVEAEVLLQLDQEDFSVAAAPAWDYSLSTKEDR